MEGVLGIDPGTRKAGYAIVTAPDSPPSVLGIEPVESLVQRVQSLLAAYPVTHVALGRGTHASRVAEALAPLGLPVTLVDETDTTYRARALYFADHPPSGWRRFVPLGLQLPPRPIDDYAALLIARRFYQGY